MKSFLLSLSQERSQTEGKPPTTPSIKPLVPQLVLDSPLKEYIPNQIMMHGTPTPDVKGTPSLKFGLTPKTKVLYAFGESPYKVLDTINKVPNKRTIDFEDMPEGSLSGSGLRKQLKTPTSVLDKILEDRGTSSNTSKSSIIGIYIPS